MISEMKELVDENGLFKVKCTVSIDLTTEEIKETMDFIRSEKIQIKNYRSINIYPMKHLSL